MNSINDISTFIDSAKMLGSLLIKESIDNDDFMCESEKTETRLGIEIKAKEGKVNEGNNPLVPVTINIDLSRFNNNDKIIFRLVCKFIFVYEIENNEKLNINNILDDKEYDDIVGKGFLDKSYPFIRKHIENVLQACDIKIELPMDIEEVGE